MSKDQEAAGKSGSGSGSGMLGAELTPGGPGGVYETQYQRSLRHYLTREVTPKEANYSNRNLNSIVVESDRRTMDELLQSTVHTPPGMAAPPDGTEASPKKKGKVIKFGWKEGVLMRCLLNIWGVMLFLRVSWMVGECGLWQALAVVIFANIVTSISAISMSAVATNGLIQGGGVYYMISRSLGPEFGGSIGLMFTVANSIAVSTYIIGFVQSLQDMLRDYFSVQMIDDGVNDIRAVGTVTLFALMALAIVGMDWVTRVQMALLFLLMGSQLDILIGVFVGPIDDQSGARGFVGFNGDLFVSNMKSDYRTFEGESQNIISVFAVFFTAVTGIVAGANLSGDLKDPGYAIPKGTLLAIAITFCSYIMYPFLLASTVVRDASGNVDVYNEFLNSSEYLNNEVTILDCPCYTECRNSSMNVTCDFGLENSAQVMELISIWGPLIYMGCFAATLSSAIASLVGAPRVLQALAKDRLYPGIYMFSKGFGANNDPVRGYCLVFVLSFLCIMIGNLNAVSTLLSNFFLASYCLINISCFHASLIKSPGWRPSFKYYNKWVSLLGGILCLITMFLIDYITALATFLITVFLYFFVSYRKPDVNWGSSTQGATYVSALKSTLDLNMVKEHVKNYRPQVLVLIGFPSSRPPLLDLGVLFTKNVGLLACGHVVKEVDWKHRSALQQKGQDWLAQKKIRAFYDLVDAEDLEKGSTFLFQLVGLGKLRPNLVLIGYKTDWKTCERSELKAYFNTLHAAFNMQLGIAILRVDSGLDYSSVIEGGEVSVGGQPVKIKITDHDEAPKADVATTAETAASSKHPYRGPGGAELPEDVLNRITVFQQKRKGTIDVWWLYDDGGLTLLLPYILSTRSNWSGCSLRIFALANKKEELDMEQRSMANLLSKFRIDYSDVIVIPDAMKKPQENSRAEFEELISKFKTNDDTGDGCCLTDTELQSQKDKTNRHIRLREMLLENSSQADLIVMTLPIPRRNHVSAPLYMAWLELITKNLPPFIFIRGNQQSVLTFYS